MRTQKEAQAKAQKKAQNKTQKKTQKAQDTEAQEMQEVFEDASSWDCSDFAEDGQTENGQSEDALSMYLQEIGQIPLITDPNEEKDLALRAANGDRAALHKLWESNLRLVVSIAKKYCLSSSSMDLLDLIQEGNLGLEKAINRFKPEMNNRFSTYAYWWIKQAITRAIADQGRNIRVPVHKQEAINKQMKVVRNLQQELGRDPSYEEIADEMGTDSEMVEYIIGIAQDTKSLDTFVGEDEDSTIGDFIADNEFCPDKIVENSMLSDDIEKALSKLSPREANILILRFGLDGSNPRSLEQVGKIYNITRERTRQLERAALEKIRNSREGQSLRDYLAA